jgi:glycosyltransferase involved in cell wall biosynthesis
MVSPIPRFGIVLPAKDPGLGFIPHLEHVSSLATSHSRCDVVVVDDGSGNKHPFSSTSQYGALCITHPQNLGKGAALRTGFNHLLSSYTDTDIIGFIDADGDIPADQVFALARVLHESPADVVAVVGTKRSQGSTYTAPLLRRLMSRAFSVLSESCMPTNVGDTQVGVKVFRAGFLREVLPKTSSTGFLLDVELLAAATRNDLQVGILPVDIALARHTSTVTLSAVAKMGTGLLELAARTRRGKKFRFGRSS